MTSLMLKRKNSIYDARIAGLYDLAETIGKGHFAVVKAAKHVFTGERVAVKVIDKNKIDDSCKQHLFQEVRCMKLVQHPNIVRLYEVIDTQTKLFLILELGDYDMFDYIMRKGERGVEECEAQRFFCQIVNAIAYCHTVHVVHRDLKPENVVFMEKFGMAKLTDFGFSNLFTPGQHLDTSCGSLAYSAPEILLGDSYDAPAVDVWSLGVILYMLVCGRLPFQEANDSETLTKILDCSYILPPHLSEDCKHVIKRMLVREPAKRATLKEIAALPWVKTGDFGHAQILPVISRDHVNDDLHEQIIEQMVVGNIASAEDICKAVEMDDYSYITATYYLLLERHLRKERHEQAQRLLNAANESSICRADSVPSKMNNDASSPRFVQKSSETHHSPRDLENRSSTVINNASTATSSFDSISETPETFVESSAVASSTPTTRQKPKNLWRQRTCSMVQEESEDDLSVHVISSRSISPVHGLSPQSSYLVTTGSRKVSPAFMDLHDLAGRLTSGSGTSGRTTPDRSGSRSPSPIESRTSPGIARYKSMPSLSRKLPTISSSPHLFGICEEGEENGPLSPSLTSMTGDRKPKTYSSSHSTCSAEISRHGRTFSGGDSVRKTSLNTYSSVRAIRQRQAVVNVDVVKRYESPTSAVGRRHHNHHHRRPTSASTNRRSASCSSSEASDDEERRLSLIRHARFCRQGDTAPFEKRWNDDDSDDDGGAYVVGSSTSTTINENLPTANAETTRSKDAGCSGGGKNGSSTNAARNFAIALMERLSPIKENFSCSAVIGQRSPRPAKRTAHHHHHATTLDVKKLTLKLEKLVLAPIREIPPHLKKFFRHDDEEKRRSDCSKNSCKDSLSAVSSSTVNAAKTENVWLKSLSKAKSWENLSRKKPTVEISTPPRNFPFSKNNGEKMKLTKKRMGAFTNKCKKPPILHEILYCDCHQKTKKYR